MPEVTSAGPVLAFCSVTSTMMLIAARDEGVERFFFSSARAELAGRCI